MNKLTRRSLVLLLKVQPFYMPLLMISSLFHNFSPFINIYMTAEIVNEIAGNRNIDKLTWLVLITVSSNLLIGLINSVLSHILAIQAAAFGQKEPLLFNEKFMSLKYADLESPDILQQRRKIQSAGAINKHGIYGFIDLFEEAWSCTVNLILFFLLSYELFIGMLSDLSHLVTGLMLILLLVLVFVYLGVNKNSIKKIAIASNELSDSMLMINRINQFTNAYNKGKDIRLYHLDIPVMQEEKYRLDLNHQGYKKYSEFLFIYGFPGKIINHLINAVIYVVVCYNTIYGKYGIGDVVKMVSLMNKAVNSVQSLFNVIEKLKANQPFLKDYFNFLDLPQEMHNGNLSVSETKEHVFEFVNVSFRYEENETYALKNINCKFDLDGKYAIVGPNGSGKTTFIKLLTRMYQPTEGEILYNGTNISQYSYEEYRKLFAVVFQDYNLFPFTLGQNIGCSVHYDSQRIKEILSMVDFEERFQAMPDGIQTFLYKDFSDVGIEISGGEAQKIAIARALYKDSPLLIMDEPTASLDPIAEAGIYSLILNKVKEKSVLFISHRLSICKVVDEILVFSEGKLIQRGRHNELLGQDHSLYEQMWTAQAQYYI